MYGYSPVVPYAHDYQIPSVQNTKYSYWNPVWGHDQWNSQWGYPSQQVYGVKGYGAVGHQQPYVYPVSKVGHVSYQQPHVVAKSWDVVKPYHGQQSYIGQQSYGHQIPQYSYYYKADDKEWNKEVSPYTSQWGVPSQWGVSSQWGVPSQWGVKSSIGSPVQYSWYQSQPQKIYKNIESSVEVKPIDHKVSSYNYEHQPSVGTHDVSSYSTKTVEQPTYSYSSSYVYPYSGVGQTVY